MNGSSDTPRKPTIRDVAAVAGVSHGTVSRVINGGHWVSAEARTAVEAAIRETGYTANHAARSLATGRSGSIAFLLTEPQHLLFADPTFALLLRGATEALARKGMTLVLLIADSADERANVARYVRAGHVDGVLLISSHESNPLLASLISAGVPTVCSGVPLGDRAHVPTVSVDEAASAREMTRYLIDRGHEHIAQAIAGAVDGRHRHTGGHLHAELLQLPACAVREFLGKRRQYPRPGFDQAYPRARRIDVAELVLQRVPGDLGQGAGQLDPGRTAANDGDRQTPLALVRVGGPLGPLAWGADRARRLGRGPGQPGRRRGGSPRGRAPRPARSPCCGWTRQVPAPRRAGVDRHAPMARLSWQQAMR